MVSLAGRSSLVGRDADLRALQRALAGSISGTTRTVVLGGEAGIGKTRLIDEFISLLTPDVVAVRGQCVDLDRDAPPYAPVIALLRGLIARLGGQAVAEAAGPRLDSLGVLVPELAVVEQSPFAEVGWSAAGGAGRLYDTVAAVLENCARISPLVVVIEDLHWADTATLELLRFLVRVAESSRVLFVFSFRTEDAVHRHPLRGWLPELDRNRRVERRELSRLTRPQARQLVTALCIDSARPVDFGVVYERTDGVPFFIEELLACGEYDADECFPDTLRDILLARYNTVSEPAQRILRLLASGGVRVEHELIAAVSPVSDDELEGAAREAVLAHVLVVDGTAYSFRHALVRDAIHDELLPGERVRFHTAFAEALERNPDASGAQATEIAYHWMAAHNVPRAFSAALEAMASARASFAFTTAARMGERAIELWEQVPDAEYVAGRPREQLLAETAYILRNAGNSERAVAFIDEAIAHSSPRDAPVYARMLRDKASFLANIGRVGSIELLREALSVLDGEPRSVLRANVLGELAARLMLEARFDLAIETADRAYVEAEAVGSLARMSVAANIRGMSTLSSGAIADGLADLELAGRLAEDNDSARLRYWVNQSDAMNLLGRYSEAIRYAEEGAARATERGVCRTSGAMFLNNMISPLFATGETVRADELLDRALELDSPIGFSSYLQFLKLQSTLFSGDPASAERLLRSWRPALAQQQRIDFQIERGVATVAAEIALERGQNDLAWRETALVIDPEHRFVAAYDLPLLAISARALAAVRRDPTPTMDGAEAAEAEERIRILLARAAHWPSAPVYASLVSAELGGEHGTGTDARLWGLAVEAARLVDAPAVVVPYALLRLAGALASSGERAGALARIAEARDRASAIGAGLILARLSELEIRAGQGQQSSGTASSRFSGSASLTERERQVLELIEQGLSNRQIADRLFISVKTASVHVSNILRKIGASTRTEAAFLARRSAAIAP